MPKTEFDFSQLDKYDHPKRIPQGGADLPGGWKLINFQGFAFALLGPKPLANDRPHVVLLDTRRLLDKGGLGQVVKGKLEMLKVQTSVTSAVYDDIAKYMKFILLVDSIASALEQDHSEHWSEIRGELTETVPSWLEGHGVDIDTIKVDPNPIQKYLASVDKAWAGKCTVAELYEEFGDDFAYKLVMQSVGHGVGLEDHQDMADYLEERGCSGDEIGHMSEDAFYDAASVTVDEILGEPEED